MLQERTGTEGRKRPRKSENERGRLSPTPRSSSRMSDMLLRRERRPDEAEGGCSAIEQEGPPVISGNRVELMGDARFRHHGIESVVPTGEAVPVLLADVEVDLQAAELRSVRPGEVEWVVRVEELLVGRR